MKIWRYFSIITIAAILAIVMVMPVSGAEFADDDADYWVEYDDEAWYIDDIEFMFGDLWGFDEMLISDPLVLANDNDAVVIISVSERDDYEYDFISFIEEMMEDLVINDIYETEDTFTDSNGDEFMSRVTTMGMAPEYEEEAIFLIQTFFTDGKRFELCYLALPDTFADDYYDAVGIMDSLDVG